MTRVQRKAQLLARTVVLFSLAGPAGAMAQALPPVHPLGSVESVAKELLGAVSAARGLPDGSVLVQDIVRRRLLRFERGLATSTVLADATMATYGNRGAGLLPYKGDSSLFVDAASVTMTVIDGAGGMGRIMAIPRPDDASQMLGGPNGTAGFDDRGRLIYRARSTYKSSFTAAVADSAPLVALDLATRRSDTLTIIHLPKRYALVRATTPEKIDVLCAPESPLPQADDWAVLTDGSVVVVRFRDYHVDVLRAGGALTAAPKIAFPWHHLDDAEKATFLDSAKAAQIRLNDGFKARALAGAFIPPPPGGSCGGYASPSQTGIFPTLPPTMSFFSASELPDYAPPLVPGSTHADLDGNLWVRTTLVIGGGSVYDVIDVTGKLVDRVAAPPQRVIAGFGKGGIVYMGVRDSTGVRLEQARWR